ncbi:MAG: hypothetical protein ABIQ72_12810 [Usitatibacter sp.]
MQPADSGRGIQLDTIDPASQRVLEAVSVEPSQVVGQPGQGGADVLVRDLPSCLRLLVIGFGAGSAFEGLPALLLQHLHASQKRSGLGRLLK